MVKYDIEVKHIKCVKEKLGRQKVFLEKRR